MAEILEKYCGLDTEEMIWVVQKLKEITINKEQFAMTTVFGKEGNDFYSAFYVMDPAKRRESPDSWVKGVTPIPQDAVSKELKMFVKSVTKDKWTDKVGICAEKVRVVYERFSGDKKATKYQSGPFH